MEVNFVNLKAQYNSIKDEIDNAIKSVLTNTDFILGKSVEEFECKYAEFCNAKYAVGVASGTEAIFLSLKALGISEGDEVITAANTFIATVLGITQAGATPVLVDIDSVSYNIDSSKIEAAITPKTKAIMPVHIYGQMVDMDAIMEIARKNNLKVIEDACQAHGAEYKGRMAGSIGNLSCFSFYPSKNLGAYGDGGMVVSNNRDLCQKVKILRDYGQNKKYHYEIKGYNSRLDTLQAAVLLAKLPHLDEWNDNRLECARLYSELLANVDIVTPIEGSGYRHVYHLYVIRTAKRDEMLEFLKSKNIFCGIHYPVPIHFQNAFKDLGYKKSDFPITEEYASKILSLPMYPEISEEQIIMVVRAVKEFLRLS